MKVRTGGQRKAFVGRLKIYGKGTVNLPKEVLELMNLSRGDEIVITAREGVAEIRKPKSLEELLGSLKGLRVSEEELSRAREHVYSGFRNAFADAYEFFEDIKEGLPYKNFVVGEFHNKVYLQLENGDLRKTMHFSYFELPRFPSGVITIDGGIKEFLESEEDKNLVNKKKERIRENLSNLLLQLKEFGDNGFILFVEPEFSRREAALLSVVVDRVINS